MVLYGNAINGSFKDIVGDYQNTGRPCSPFAKEERVAYQGQSQNLSHLVDGVRVAAADDPATYYKKLLRRWVDGAKASIYGSTHARYNPDITTTLEDALDGDQRELVTTLVREWLVTQTKKLEAGSVREVLSLFEDFPLENLAGLIPEVFASDLSPQAFNALISEAHDSARDPMTGTLRFGPAMRYLEYTKNPQVVDEAKKIVESTTNASIRATAEITVKKLGPISTSVIVAVHKGLPSQIVSATGALTEALRSALVGSKRFQAIDAAAQTAAIRELEKTLDDFHDERSQAQLGKFLGATAVVSCSIRGLAGSLQIVMDYVDVETGAIKKSVTATSGTTVPDLKKEIEKLAQQLAQEI
ncbi:MAG: hypothetical protein HQM16_18710 [Deltaproteobacteria bacterium]|nr:hypothetical protein [Deltaproteobacteria bacterium]